VDLSKIPSFPQPSLRMSNLAPDIMANSIQGSKVRNL
jgi:hypothetical protein